MFNIIDFGADPTGTVDSTKSIQKAIDEAGKSNSCVYIPSGEYLTDELFIASNIEIRGEGSWSYRGTQGSVLKLNSKNAKSLFNLSNCIGAYLDNLVLLGNNLGDNIHGVMRKNPEFSSVEDTTKIERCKITDFSGDGIHFDKIWCYSVRFSMISNNKGHGLYMDGYDGFLLDNWFSGNRKWGMYFNNGSNALTISSNRIEWNGQGGAYFLGGGMCNFGGNYIDRSGGPAICIKPKNKDDFGGCYTLTGNVLYRSGANLDKSDEYSSCHIYI